ncbi:hypothetical protein K0M31_011990 [Melipona bicolor]|uniref:Uncharacterized protein n=1 Tax=Melipona bicolor TaxID=60889 RepID=A0AA40GAL0_9HYME|nr:hypothetical protein K0M31_011990 [Melipona bicolor]
MPVICYGREAESKEKEQGGRNGERGRIYREKGSLWICSQGKETSPTQTATKSQRQPRNNPLLPPLGDDACTQGEREKRKERVCGGGSKMEDVQEGRERPKRVETMEVKTERNQNRESLETVLNHSSLSLSLSLLIKFGFQTTTSFQIATLGITPTTDRLRYTESGCNFELFHLPASVS